MQQLHSRKCSKNYREHQMRKMTETDINNPEPPTHG
jgi:hypothetical protein